MPERADARDVVRAEPREELLRGGAQQRQVALHAARDVQHDDEPDGLGGVVEQRDRLGLPFVAHLEVVPRERRDEPAVSIRHGDEDTDGVARAAEHRLLPPGRAKHAKDARGERQIREGPSHAHHSFLRKRGTCSYSDFYLRVVDS